MRATGGDGPDRTTLPAGRDWWRGAVGYEIYIRSFFDSDGDGMGDLGGITAKLDVLDRLGIDVIWITPFYPSPGKDQGYDVADYTAVDPAFGTLVDFDELVARATERGLRIFVDIVPNHTSDRHPWFEAAIADIDSPYRQYYLFRPAGPDGGPPNNWVSHFGGPAWTLDPAGTGEYYCHLFLPEQPDLNWANPSVMEEFRAILRFWCERGVDGFRIDVAHGLTKDPEFRDNPQVRAITPGMHPKDVFASFQHVHDLHRPETTKIFDEWRTIVAPYDAVLLGEMDVRNIDRFTEYVGGKGLDAGFVLKLSASYWEPATILSDILTYERAARGGGAWALSNHDQPRAVSRFGGGEVGIRRAIAVMALMLALDGITFVYQGEELGLPDAVLTGRAMDPVSTRNEGASGRDVARGPMPWNSEPVNGFTTAAKAWLETEPLDEPCTAAAQVGVPGSIWERYRAMLDLRHRLPALWAEPFEIFDRQATSLVLFRGNLTIIANLDDKAFEFVPEGEHHVEFESQPGAAGGDGGLLRIAPESTVVIRRRGD
ncbi:MAG: HAD-superfamily hydrolase, subfamily variant 3 [Ilumatobacteraceae bacterium]|nr:HAD-superfamily hydrolase, subfamily variant 3 [Ilumatobacteraceae bacterium]